MNKTDIEWTGYTWNVFTGCTKVSPGCLHCYAERLAHGRLKNHYPNGFSDVKYHSDRLKIPLTMKKPREIFVNSMSDFFHEKISNSSLLQALSVIKATPQHIYQVLTKRPERMQDFMSRVWFDGDVALLSQGKTSYEGLKNLWLGVSVENKGVSERINFLRETPAQTRFLSCEPLLESLNGVDLTSGIDWIIVGGESGSRFRPIEKQWVEEIRNHCIESGVPFFFKQWGGRTAKKNGRLLDGMEWNEKPQMF